MTTPTTDADRLTQIEEVVDQWRIAEPGNRLTDAEALAKVRALVLGDRERDESKPPPGWEHYSFTDEDGCQHEAANVRRTRWHNTIAEAWALYDAEHGYAPQGAPPDGSKP